MIRKLVPSAEEAQVIALKILTFFAADEMRLERFLAVSGVGPEDLGRRAAEPDFLGGVMDHLLGDQSLLLLFAEIEAIAPETIMAARNHLPGAPV